MRLMTFPDDTRIHVYPFERRVEGDDVVIANHTQSSFLAVPAEAVQLLDWLAAGRTVGEARANYQRTYGVVPDLDDFLDTLAREAFIAGTTGALNQPREAVDVRSRYHFQSIPVAVARRLLSPPVLVACAFVIGVALLAVVSDPGVVPGPASLVFPHDQILLVLLLVLFSIGSVVVHELAHLVAARAAGVPSKMAVSHRLWIVVAETDMTGIWMASRRQRMLAFLAGPMSDATSAAVLFLILFAQRHGWVDLDVNAVALAQAFAFVYLTRLLWQLEFFVPTDLYYVIATAFRCKNLMSDTQVYLLNTVARALPWIPTRGLSAVPRRELAVIRYFAVVWVLGRALAFVTLFWITLPVIAGYGRLLTDAVSGDQLAARSFTEGPLFPLLAVTLQCIGLAMWLRGLLRFRRSSR
jgi:hypothetical protein